MSDDSPHVFASMAEARRTYFTQKDTIKRLQEENRALRAQLERAEVVNLRYHEALDEVVRTAFHAPREQFEQAIDAIEDTARTALAASPAEEGVKP
jgi:hypothetical protein